MEKSTLVGIGTFMLILLGSFFLFNKESVEITNNAIAANEVSGDVRHIVVDAKWFEFSPSEIRVKEGENVMLMINNLDVLHGIVIPELGVSGMNTVEFTATKKGEFNFYCNNFCGEGHKDMIGKIIVE